MPANYPKPAKILYLITELDIVGGAERLLSRLLTLLDRTRFVPTVACLYGGNGPMATEIRALDVSVIDLGMTHRWRLDALWRLYRLLRCQRPDLVHAAMFHANLAGRIVGRLAHVPLIVTWRHSASLGGSLREFANRCTVTLDDRIVAVSELVRQIEIQRAHISPNRVITISNGVDVTEFSVASADSIARIRQSLGISSQTRLLGAIGRFDPSKNFTNLFEAMARVRDHTPSTHLVIAGEGALRSELEAAIRSLELTSAVTLMGFRQDIPDVLGALDCFVLSSDWEGVPLVILEAMAAGLPVVATKVGGVPEVVVDGETGFLVPPADPDALAQAIIKLLADADLRHRMGQAGQARVRAHFDIRRMVKQTESLYEKLLIEKGIWQ